LELPSVFIVWSIAVPFVKIVGTTTAVAILSFLPLKFITDV